MSSTTIVLEGMGSICSPTGVGFRVWAPGAEKVGVVGDFQDWNDDNPLPMEPEGDGYWYGFSAEAEQGHEYKFLLENEGRRLFRIDPYAREVTHSNGNGIIYDPSSYDWTEDDYQLPPLTDLVIYECHIGTFSGDFAEAGRRLKYLKALGFNALELMPVTEFPGERSWGYNPAHIFSVETDYGGVEGLKDFIKLAHREGIGIILDLVYNHLGPDDLGLWNFDGSAESGKGGPYFYADERAKTPWGHTRPNYGSGPVRRFLRDNLMMWLTEYNIDGVRTDGTVYIRKESHDSGDLPEGWSLLQWFTEEAAALDRWRVMIAEDLQNDEWLTKTREEGGAGFHCQWDAKFCHPLREMLTSCDDSERSVSRLVEVLSPAYNGDPFQSVIFTENHDEVANGSARVVSEINWDDPDSAIAQARALLGIAIVLTAPGVPMMFQGQERMEAGYFEDDRPIDWSQDGRDAKALKTCRDFISLRSGADDRAPELRTSELQVLRAEEESGYLIVSRGSGDLLLIYNLRNNEQCIPISECREVLASTCEYEVSAENLRVEPYGALIIRGQL